MPSVEVWGDGKDPDFATFERWMYPRSDIKAHDAQLTEVPKAFRP